MIDTRSIFPNIDSVDTPVSISPTSKLNELSGFFTKLNGGFFHSTLHSREMHYCLSVKFNRCFFSSSDDLESLQAQKNWRKSIMLVWRAAANHK